MLLGVNRNRGIPGTDLSASHWAGEKSRSATFKSRAAAPQPFGLLVLAVLQNCIGAEAFARFQGAEKLYPFYFESVTRTA